MSKNFSQITLWRQKLYGHLALARISNSPTVFSNALAGAALAGARQVDGKLVLVAIAMILFYSAGMYLNDLLDYVLDCQERPTRPLPAGIVSKRAATVGVIALFGCGSILLGIVGLYSFLSGLVLIALIICYDRWHKNNPISPLLMALCRGMVYITAFLAFSAQSIFNLNLLLPCGLLMLYVIGLTYIAKVENKMNGVNVGIVVLLFLPVMYFMGRPSLFSLLFALIFAAWVVYSISFIYDSSERQVGRTVGQLIAGIALLDSVVLVVRENYQGLLLALVAFGLTLFLQRFVKGT